MQYVVPVFALTLLLAGIVSAFEIDGLRNGMSQAEVKKALEASYEGIQIKDDNYIEARQASTSYFIYATFCKGKLVQVQKDLNPRFDYFVRLVEQKTGELGKPIAAWTNPARIDSPVESNSVSFLWKEGQSSITVSYTEFPSNKQLYIVYEIKNSCS